MVTNSFGKRNFMQPMGRLNMHSWGGWVGASGEKGGGGLFFVFLPCSITALAISTGEKR
jgi:hypothetical protein